MARTSGRGRTLRRAAALSAAGVAAGIGYSATRVPHALDLPPAVSGERREAVLPGAGRVSWYVAGAGEPVLLVHSINAAASAYEVRPIFEALRGSRRVYAVDLPGFGFSDRSSRPYDVALYVAAVRGMVDVITEETGARWLDALAVSLGCEFLARVASEQPERFRTLALVTPTGFSRGSSRLTDPAGGTREVPGLHGLFSFPVWGQAVFDLLVSRRSVRYFLRRTYGRQEIDQDLWDYDYRTAHQPGAKNAPFAFVSGRLFSKDIRSVYERLRMPVWMPHATRGDFRDFSEADWARARPNWTVQPYPTGALPQFEQPEPFMADYRRFLGAHATATAGPG